VTIDTTVNASAEFSDADDGGAHVATWDWGDGTTSTGSVDQSANTVSGSHDYDEPGVYSVSVTVTDANGDGVSAAAVFRYVVVYDPDGGFVTGGGWIDSPAGAYAADEDLTGKATFGFVAKYHNGANVPEGSTEFQFKAGDLKFKATLYEWLVTPGQDKGKFKGSGEINGGGDYGFMLTVKDNGSSGDTLRIKIWDKDAGNGVVYDNKPGSSDQGYDGTAIGGGNIKVHKP
jgi:PKD repeat protein